MDSFGKIAEIIKNFQKDADRSYESYQEKEKRARARYSPEAFREEFIMKTWAEASGRAQANVEITISEVMEVFDDIENKLKKFMMQPLSESTAQILDCINKFGLKLSLNELQVIEESLRDSYIGLRIFSGLSEKNGYIASIPSMKQLQDALKSARGNASLAIKAYAGSPDDKFPGKDLLGTWSWQGVSFGNYTSQHMFMSYNYLREGGELDRLRSMFASIHAPVTYKLNESESEKVKKAVGNIIHDGEIDKKAAQKLIKEQPDIKDRLESMPDDFFADKEALVSYFRLNEKEESKIDAATQNAKEYGTRFQKVDAEMLRQYE